MPITVKKWGNSASVRIPSAIMAAAKLKIDSKVDIREEGGRAYFLLSASRASRLGFASCN